MGWDEKEEENEIMLNNEVKGKIYVIKAAYALTAIVLPFILLLILYWLTGNGFDLTELFPTYSDEIGWYTQIRSYVECGGIYGNYGYNGNSAPMLGTGAWGYIILIPYILVGKIFGMSYFTMVIANILFISLAVLVFVLLVRPTKKQYFALYISEISVYFMILYLSISMSESLRYAMSILILAFLIKLYRGEGNFVYRYVTVPVVLLLHSMIFMLNVIWFPVYFFYILRLRHMSVNLIINVLGTAVIAVVVNGVTGLTSCPYIHPSTIQQIMDAFRKGFGNGVAMFVNTFIRNLYTVDLFRLISDAKEDYGATSWFFVFYLIMTACFLVVVYANKSWRKKEQWQWVLGVYLLVGFLFAFCGLYTGVRWTLARGICVGFTAVMFLLSVCGNKKIYAVVLALIFLGFPSFYQFSSESFAERKISEKAITEIENERMKLKEQIKITTEGNRWNNTVAYYGQVDSSLLAIPEGLGLNCMFDTAKVCEARWAFVDKSYQKDSVEKLAVLLKDSGCQMVCESRSFYVYKRQHYSNRRLLT